MVISTPYKYKRKKVKYDKEVKEILTNLNKILTLNELSKKINVSYWRLFRYKRGEIKKKLDKKPREKLVKFHKKLIQNKENEGYRYGFDIRRIKIGEKDIKRKGRYITIPVIKHKIIPVVGHTINKIKELEKIGLTTKQIAHKLEVNPSTIDRWKRSKVKRIRNKYQKILHELHKKKLPPLSGVFLITKQVGNIEYIFYVYIREYRGTIENLLAMVTRETGGEVEKYIIKKRGDFDKSEILDLIDDLKNVNLKYIETSRREILKFVLDNFKDKDKKQILKRIKQLVKESAEIEKTIPVIKEKEIKLHKEEYQLLIEKEKTKQAQARAIEARAKAIEKMIDAGIDKKVIEEYIKRTKL